MGNTSAERKRNGKFAMDEAADPKTSLTQRTRRAVMKNKLAYAIAILAVGAATTVVSAQRQETNTAPAHGRYLPELSLIHI